METIDDVKILNIIMYKSKITAKEMEKLDLISFPGKIYVIDKLGAEFNRAINYLRNQKILGFDTETRPCFTAGQPQNNVSLLQLSTHGRAYLFRLNVIGMHRRLCNLMANPNIVKVGAAIHDDIRGLKKLRSFKSEAFVDLQKIVGDYGIQDKSVKKMSAIILGHNISKSQQLSNWEAPELSEAQLMYAATDAWVCREMYIKLLETSNFSSERNES